MRLPTPVLLWIALLGGHGLVAFAPLPAAWEEGCRIGAVLLAILSVLAALVGRRHHARVRAAILLERLEWILGFAALIAAGGALAGETDRSEAPLPVHPRPVAVVVEGRVLDAVASDAALPMITLQADTIGVGAKRAACGAAFLVRFGDDGPPPSWALPGIAIRFRGTYRALEDARNPGSAAPGRWQERSGIAGTIEADPTSVVVVGIAPDASVPWSGLLRLRLARLFARDLSPPVAALARGMALGDRSGITPRVRDAFRDGGTIHILSISGLHVCVLAGIVAAIAVAFRLPSAAALLLEMLSLWGYVLLVGAPASAVRSAILWTAMRAGRLRGAPVRPFAAWGVAGLLIHLALPTALEDPGFQLSFAAVLGLLASSGLKVKLRGFASGLVSLTQQSAFAEAGTLGIQVLQFGAVPVAGLFLNLAVIPLCGAFVAALLVQLGCALLAPWLEPAASGAVEVSGLLMLKLTAAVARAVPPWPARALPPVPLLVAALLGLLLAAGVAQHARANRRRAGIVALASLLLAWIAPFLPVPHALPRTPSLLVLDVGQGDATIVRAGHSVLLVDGGPRGESRDEGRSTVEPALRAEGITRVDAAILSHAHRDHYGGLGWLATRGFLGRLYENGSDPHGAWRAPLAGVSAHTIHSDTSVAKNLRITRVSDSGTAASRTGNAHENNRSLVAFLDLSGHALCFAGDVEHDAEMELLRRGGCSPAAIVKVPHHGSRTSSDSAWIAALKPRVALISCGEGNRFGHPDRATVGRYLKAHARVYRTDREGAIRITITPGGALVSTRAHPAPERVPWREDSWYNLGQ